MQKQSATFLQHTINQERWNTEQRNAEQWWNSGKSRNSGRTTEHLETPVEYQWNTNRTPAEHTEPYKMKNNCSILKKI